jgi:hypothetical protein
VRVSRHAAVFWVARRGRRAGTRAFTEAACPLCLALGWLSERQPFEHAVGIDAGGEGS